MIKSNIVQKSLGKMNKKESECEDYSERVDENYKELDDFLLDDESNRTTQKALKTKNNAQNSMIVSEEIEEMSNAVEINMKIHNKYKRHNAINYNNKIIDASKIM